MNDPAPAVVRLAQFAKAHNVTKAAVTKWRKAGYLTMTDDGRVDVGASNAKLAQRAAVNRRGQPTKGPFTPDTTGAPKSGDGSKAAAPLDQRADPPPTGEWSLAEAQRLERVAIAQLRRIEADRAAGKVAPVEEMEREWTAAFAGVRAGVLAASSRIAQRLPHLSLEDISTIDDELRVVLTEAGGGDR